MPLFRARDGKFVMRNCITIYCFLALQLMLNQHVFAADDLVNCKWENGLDMSEDVCNDQRYLKATSAEERDLIDEKRRSRVERIKKEREEEHVRRQNLIIEGERIKAQTILDSERIKSQMILDSEEKKKANAPGLIKEISKDQLCVLYGQAIRGDGRSFDFDIENGDKLILAEAKKRKIKVNIDLVKKSTIKLGMSVCALYASWGMPIDENKSVGSWGVHIQHVYGDSQYVYTENGIVTSWQN